MFISRNKIWLRSKPCTQGLLFAVFEYKNDLLVFGNTIYKEVCVLLNE